MRIFFLYQTFCHTALFIMKQLMEVSEFTAVYMKCQKKSNSYCQVFGEEGDMKCFWGRDKGKK